MKRLACSLVFLLCACGRPTEPPGISTEIARTSYGVAHINALNFHDLGMGLAYAYAQDNVCMFADSLLTVRGERARFFGAQAHATRRTEGEYGAASDFFDLNNEDSDFFFKAYLDREQLRAAYAQGAMEIRDLLRGYADGYNRYLTDYAGHLPKACQGAAWVRNISEEDVMLVVAEKALHASGEVFAKEIVDAARDEMMPLAHTVPPLRPAFARERLAALTESKLGSNALAVGSELSADGRGLVLGNPHYPWTSTDRFYQVHLTVPGSYEAMGVSLGGLPLVVIGFNKDVAWTHTVTTALHFNTVKLSLDQGFHYVVDGQRKALQAKTVSVQSLQADGSLRARAKTFYFSEHGALMVKPEAGLVWSATTAFALADPNRNNTRLLEQWLGIGRARNIAELKASLASVSGLPWVNTVAADRYGQVLFEDASVVPHISDASFVSNCMLLPALLLLDGSRSACQPPGIFSPHDAPQLSRKDYVGNSNDSYWLSNPRAMLTGFSPMYGREGVEQSLRTRIGFLQFEQRIAAGAKIAMLDLQNLVYANRIYAAEIILPDLLQDCPDDLADACRVLVQWDKLAELNSRGSVLFREFWNAAASMRGLWKTPFDPADPVNTPSGLSPAAHTSAFALLRAAVAKLQAASVPLDARLGDYQGDTRNGRRYAIHGGIGNIDGAYNSIHMGSGLDAAGYKEVVWGTSYVQTVGFDASGPVAEAMLNYGQSTDPASPHYSDQLSLYSEKRWIKLPFRRHEILADPQYAMTRLK